MLMILKNNIYVKLERDISMYQSWTSNLPNTAPR